MRALGAKRVRWAVAGAVLLAPFLQGTAVEAQEGEGASCFSSHASGSGAGFMTICISEHGNLVKLESPAGFEHLGIGALAEGYVLCGFGPSGESRSFDSGGSEMGFGPSTVRQPNGPNTFPLTIIRDTLDGVYRLTQKFTFDGTKRDIVIQMKVTNMTAEPSAPVRVVRYFDARLDNFSTLDRYVAREDSAWAWANRKGLMLSALTYGTLHTNALETLTNWDPNGPGGQGARVCETAPVEFGPTPHGDYVARVRYFLGTLPPGGSGTVKFLYRLF